MCTGYGDAPEFGIYKGDKQMGQIGSGPKGNRTTEWIDKKDMSPSQKWSMEYDKNPDNRGQGFRERRAIKREAYEDWKSSQSGSSVGQPQTIENYYTPGDRPMSQAGDVLAKPPAEGLNIPKPTVGSATKSGLNIPR